MQAMQNEEAKSFYYPPDAEDEPQELTEIAEQAEKEIELRKKIFGIPAFRHNSSFRSIDGSGTWEEWLAPARPLDITHRIDAQVIDGLLRNIKENPPELPQNKPFYTGDIIEANTEEGV